MRFRQINLRKLWLSLLLLVGATAIAIPGIQEVMDGNVAKIGSTEYATLQAAFDAAQDGETVTLLSDYSATGETNTIETNRNLCVTKSITIDGQNHTLTVNKRGIAVKGISSKIDVTFKDITIQNSVSGGRCIDTRGNIGTLTIIDSKLSTGGGGYDQPLTIGGNQSDAATVNITNSTIQTNDAGTAYYAIITFNPVNMNITESTIKGWACIYAKGPDGSSGSAGSVFDINNSTIVSSNAYSGVSNDFSAIMIEDNNVSVNVDNSNITINNTGDQVQTLVGYNGFNKNGTINLGEGNIVNFAGPNDCDLLLNGTGSTLSLTGGTYNFDPTNYLAEGYTAVENNGKWTVQEKTYVAQIGDTKFETLADAVGAAAEGQTIQVIKDGDYTLPNLPQNVTIEATVDGVVFNHTAAGSVASIPNGATFKNVTFNFGNVNYHGFQHAGTINMEGCTLNGKLFSYGDMNFTDCSFNQSNSDYHMWAYSGNLTYTDCTFTNSATGKFLNVYNESGATKYTVTATNCKFVNQGSSNKAALNVKATSGSNVLAYDVILNNCTTEGAFPEANWGDALVVLNSVVQVDDRTDSGVDNITVTQDGTLIYPVTVAAIGETKYPTLQSAINAAHEMTGDVTITLLDDITGYSIVHQKAGLNLTIDGAEKTVAGQIIIDGDGRLAGTETLTIKNIKFEGNKTNFYTGTDAFIIVPTTKTEGDPFYTNKYNYAHNVTVDKCSFTSTSSSLDIVAVKANSNAGLRNVIITNNTGTNLHSLAQMTGTEDGTIDNNTVDNSDSFINVSGGKGDFAISNNKFTSSSEDGYAVRENAASEAILTLTDNTFTAFKAVQLGKGAKKTNGTINVVSGTYVGDIVKDIAATATGKIVISGGKFSAPIADAQYAEFIAEGLCGVNGLYEGDAPNGIGTAVATVTSGETVLKYASLEAAIAAAPDGATVTLLANSSGNGIKVPEGKYSTGLTVDFGGFTYTVDGTTVGSTGTETQAFQLLKNNKITFQNGTIYSEKALMLVQNYSDLTLDGMTLDGSALVGSSKVYTLSNNNGNVVINNSTITAKEGDGNFAFDVCRYASYPSVSVTVKGTSEINGNIEVSASKNDPKDGFGLTLEAGTFNGNIVLAPSAEAVLSATPEKAVIKKSNSLTTVAAPQDYKWVDNGDGTSTLAPCVYVAQIGEGESAKKFETLTAAVAAAQSGETIELLADITTETGNKSLKEGVTLDGKGKTISGDIAIYISKNGGTVQNVNFKNIHNAGKTKSAVYSESLEGTATITGCTFDNCDWDAIQITPKEGANVVITNNTFSDDADDGVTQKRYIHVQSAVNVDFSATITENVMLGNNGGPMDVYYPTDKSKVNLTNNYIETVDDVLCILVKDDDGFAGELAFPAYTTADKEETYSPEAYIQNGQYAAKFYTTFAEAATAAGNDKVISLVKKPSTAYTMSEGQTLKVKKNGKSITVNGPAGYAVTSTTTDGVTTYTLSEADIEYTAANGTVKYMLCSGTMVSGDGTYKLLKDVTTDARIAPGILASDVTLDLNGHTLTSTATDCAILLSRAGSTSKPKIFNLIDSSDEKGGILKVNPDANIGIQVSGKYNQVTIGEGVTVDGGCVALLSENQTLTVNGTINGGNDFAVATNGSTTKNATITINDGAVLTSNVTAMYLPGTGTTNISGGTITGSNGIYVKSGVLNITGGEITGNGETAEFEHNPNGTSIVGAALVVENCSYPGGAPTVNVTGGTFTSANADAIASYSYGDGNEPIDQFVHGGYFSTELDRAICEEGKKTVPSTVKEGYYELGDIVYVAKIGETKYETLEEAWNAVNDGETITLLANCEGNGLIAPQGKFTNGLTVDFAGFTYTVDGSTVGSAGTETNAFQLLKDNKITFKNGTITSEKAKILVQNYSNLTLEGMTLTLDNANYASAYTLSNNNGNVVIDGTTINANPAGGFAFDVCRYSSYPSVNVTVTGNSKINGDVEVSASKSDAKDGFKLMFESATLNGEIVLDASAKTAMANTPEKAEVSKSNTLTDIAAPDGYDWKDNGNGTSSLALTEEMEMILIHGKPYPVTKTATYKKVTYKRTFEEDRINKYQCWFVPFDYTITGEENATFYKIHLISATQEENGEVTDNTQVNINIEKMSAGEKLSANRPYIIKASNANYEFVVEPENGIKLYAPNKNSRLHLGTAEFYYDFYGTYDTFKATGGYQWITLTKKNAVAWNASANASLQSYCWYIKVTPNGDNADYSKINFIVVEEDSENATKINSIEEDADEIEGIYSANGTKKETLSKGLNIIKYKSGKTKKIYK